MATSPTHDSMANAIRFLAADAVEKANSGHPGLPMGAADIATVLFRDVLKFDAADPALARPRPVRAVGGTRVDAALCAPLPDRRAATSSDHRRSKGVPTARLEDAGPSGIRPHAVGVETTTGPLGQGIATAVGMAIAERMLAAQFPGVVDHHTYVLASDGDLMEGVSQEAIAHRRPLQLGS